MIARLLIALLAIAGLSSCATYRSGQTPDDVYYSPGREVVSDGYVTVQRDRDNRYSYNDERMDDIRLRQAIRDPRLRSFDDDFFMAPRFNSWGWNTWMNPMNTWGWGIGFSTWNSPFMWNSPFVWNNPWMWNNPFLWNNPWNWHSGFGWNTWNSPLLWNTPYVWNNPWMWNNPVLITKPGTVPTNRSGIRYSPGISNNNYIDLRNNNKTGNSSRFFNNATNNTNTRRSDSWFTPSNRTTNSSFGTPASGNGSRIFSSGSSGSSGGGRMSSPAPSGGSGTRRN
ncbi:MAG: hypothetical protein ACK4E8_00575 [Lacibacter sp.]